MVTIWGPWGICQVCGRPKNEGIKKKIGYCRVKLTQKVYFFEGWKIWFKVYF